MLAGVDGAPDVQAYEGGVAIWAGEPDDPHGLVVSPAAALETARRLVALVTPDAAGDVMLGGEVSAVRLIPSEAEGLPGRLLLRVAGRDTVLLIGWSDLISLARSAQTALEATQAPGRG